VLVLCARVEVDWIVIALAQGGLLQSFMDLPTQPPLSEDFPGCVFAVFWG